MINNHQNFKNGIQHLYVCCASMVRVLSLCRLAWLSPRVLVLIPSCFHVNWPIQCPVLLNPNPRGSDPCCYQQQSPVSSTQPMTVDQLCHLALPSCSALSISTAITLSSIPAPVSCGSSRPEGFMHTVHFAAACRGHPEHPLPHACAWPGLMHEHTHRQGVQPSRATSRGRLTQGRLIQGAISLPQSQWS